MTDAREEVWHVVIELVEQQSGANSKACIVQSAIATFGPVPNSMADAVRKAMGVKEPV